MGINRVFLWTEEEQVSMDGARTFKKLGVPGRVFIRPASLWDTNVIIGQTTAAYGLSQELCPCRATNSAPVVQLGNHVRMTLEDWGWEQGESCSSLRPKGQQPSNNKWQPTAWGSLDKPTSSGSDLPPCPLKGLDKPADDEP